MDLILLNKTYNYRKMLFPTELINANNPMGFLSRELPICPSNKHRF